MNSENYLQIISDAQSLLAVLSSIAAPTFKANVLLGKASNRQAAVFTAEVII